jgi:peptide/nickel transport system ATP-binding protein
MSLEEVLRVDELRTYFFTRTGIARAVDGVSFAIGRGRVLGLVGESGSGKSVTGYSILGLVDPPGRVTSGRIMFKGEDLIRASPARMRALRGARIAMICQDPMMTLNPVLRIDAQMVEAVRAHDPVSRDAARERAREALQRVGVSAPEERLRAFPHELSGGMRQRVCIAIALLHKPDLIIADEPTTALDVTIQAQILSEVQALCAESGTALLWITHDLAIVAGLADDIAVMYAGKIVEFGPCAAVISTPRHPYTRGLIDSVPSRGGRQAPLHFIPGMTPSLLSLPAGCAFRERCGLAIPACANDPPVTPVSPVHIVRCVRADEGARP